MWLENLHAAIDTTRCYRQRILESNTNCVPPCFAAVMTNDSRKSASLEEEQHPLLPATTAASRQAVGMQTDDHIHVNSAHRGVRTEPCEPKPPGLMKLNAVGGSHGTMQKSPLAARKPSDEFSPWRSQNRSAQRETRKIGSLTPVTSPPAKTPANLCGRRNHRSAQREFKNGSRYKAPAWNSSPEDYRRASQSPRIRDDVPRDVRGIYEAADSQASDGSVPLYGRSVHASPRRSAWPSPPLGREDKQDRLSSPVSPAPHQAVRECRQSEGEFVNQVTHCEGLFIPPHGAYSSQGTRNRPGATNMFRRFDSTIVWATDEYSKHKQQGPGRRFDSTIAWVTDEYSKHKQQGPGRRFDSTMAWVTDEYSKHKQQGPGRRFDSTMAWVTDEYSKHKQQDPGRRFDSTIAWFTDEYSKHKQQGPGRRFDSIMAWVTDEYSKHKQQGPGRRFDSTMAWVMDEYSKHKQQAPVGVSTQPWPGSWTSTPSTSSKPR
ncbi:uncharacterized protein [Dermacentor andersoni]|uniref:uncharacterized protein n=1 Tax=Dermacentor andersoni TaxID=34620 RepID=UPI00241658A6|nr:uncharacterized protein LOC129387940 [Dermacentor andersoni]